MIVIHEALHLHIGSIIENIAIEEMSEAAQEPEGEPQFQEEPDAAQDANLNSINSATDQGKLRCIPPYYYYESYHLLYTCICALIFIGFDLEPTCINNT